ncbi:MAG: hypothetical protein WD342_03625 [Verrucomicrobiales bacterium]
MQRHALPWIALLTLLLSEFDSHAQLRRPGFVTVEREDRTRSQLAKEKGAIYLEEMVEPEVVVRVTDPVAAYSTLNADRHLGTLVPNQNAVLLAVSEKAYRVRARAKQGQIAGWVSKSAVTGLPEDFEANLREYYERYQVVQELIDNHQVALGMSVDEVVASIGPPDKRSSQLTKDGRTDSLEYVSYERVPQTVMTYDAFGRPVPTTRYVEMESGRVQIDFVDDTVTSISESEGIDFSGPGGHLVVPPPVFLF